jgi:hypothetical protein
MYISAEIEVVKDKLATIVFYRHWKNFVKEIGTIEDIPETQAKDLVNALMRTTPGVEGVMAHIDYLRGSVGGSNDDTA